jgi:Protein of unknown function (DUF3014)
MGRYDRDRSKQPSKAAFIITILASLLIGIGGTYFVIQNYKHNKMAAALDSGGAKPSQNTVSEKFPDEQNVPIEDESELLPTAPAVAGAAGTNTTSDLPDLLTSDDVFRGALIKLSPGLRPWLNSNLLIRKYVVIINDFSQGQRIFKHLSFLRLEEPFAVEQGENGLQMAPKNYRRYDLMAQTINAIDTRAAVALYKRFRPLMLQVFAEFSYPQDITLEGIVKKAGSEILAAPAIDGPVALVRPSVFYKFSDPALEALNPVQKQMIRMGPENTRLIQNKCRDFLVELGKAGLE